MADIKKLMLTEADNGSKEYKSGWNDAVCYMLETHTIKDRKNEVINIVITLDEKKIKEALNDK